MRSYLILLLSCLATLSFAQVASPPVITSVVQNANNQFATLSWTFQPSQCQAFCWFRISRDNGIVIDTLTLGGDGPTSFVYPIYFGNGATDVTFGPHTFLVTFFDIITVDTPTPSAPFAVTFVAPAPVNPPSDIVGDPQFMGLKGQLYQVHGAPNEVFNIISSPELQYNSKFVYLSSGECPTMDGEPVDTACFTHPGTYLGELGLETSNGDRVYIRAGPAATGLANVELNGVRLAMNEVIELAPAGFLVRNNSHVLTLQAGNFRIEFTNSDMFVNQVVEMLDTTLTTSHGLLGQSWSTKVHNAKASIPWIEGTVWDYAVEDHQLFSDKFTFNKFVKNEERSEKDEKKSSIDQSDAFLQKLKQRMLKSKK